MKHLNTFIKLVKGPEKLPLKAKVDLKTKFSDLGLDYSKGIPGGLDTWGYVCKLHAEKFGYLSAWEKEHKASFLGYKLFITAQAIGIVLLSEYTSQSNGLSHEDASQSNGLSQKKEWHAVCWHR